MGNPTPIIEILEGQVKNFFSLDKMLAHFVLNVDSHVTKKNNRPIHRRGWGHGKTFLGKSTKLRNAEEFFDMELTRQARAQGLVDPIDCPLWVIMHFYFAPEEYFTKKGEISMKLPDLSNLYQLPEDALQKAGVIKNDCLIHSHDLSRRLVGDKTRLEIFILKHTMELKWKSPQKNF